MTPTSRPCARLSIGAVATALIALLLAATASAATTSQRKASLTDAITGMSDASSVVPRGACSLPEPGHAACLAQFLVQRQTGQRVHPHLLPAAAPNRVLRVRGKSAGAAHAAAVAATTTPVPAPQPGSPAYLQQAYDLAALAQTHGGDQTIAIVDAYDAPNAELNMTTYRTQFGLPLCTSASGCFQRVNEFGKTDVMPSKPPPGKTGWQTEIALDLEVVSAICPHCKIELVESFTDGLRDLAAAQLAASKMSPTPNVITDSWGGVPASEKTQSLADSDQQWDQNSGTFTFPGIATVAASGDFGYLGAGQNAQCKNGLTQASCNVYPAALPGVTAAGGTSLVPANGTGAQAARGLSEVAWSGTGSGCDTTEPKPHWQTDTGCAGRAYNDLSAEGDPTTGMSIYAKSDGGWEVVGGTSLSSPLIAAYYALVNSASAAATAAAGGTPPSWAFSTGPSWAYNIASTLPNVFNDPSSGSNGTCDPLSVPAYICTATSGYDGPTGLGTVSGAVVPGAPGLGAAGFGEIAPNDPTSNGTSYAKTVTANSATLQGGVYPNGNDTTYFWQYGTDPVNYGETTPNTDIGAGTAPVGVSDTITGLAPKTVYYYRLVAQSPDPANPGFFLTQYGNQFQLTTSDAGSSVGGGGAGGGTGGSGGTGGGTGTGGTGGSGGTGGGTGSGGTGGGSGGTGTGTGGNGGGGGQVTHAPNAPSFGSLRIKTLGSSTATVTETLNTGSANTTYYLAYGTTSRLTQRTASATSSKSGTVIWHLRGLRAGTVYYLQAIATNAGGTRRTSTVRVKTSPVSVGKIITQGNKLRVALRCRGAAKCRVSLAVKVGKRTVASGRATLRGNHRATITLKLNRAAAARAGHSKHPRATLSAVSVWNGYAATVAAKFRLALS